MMAVYHGFCATRIYLPVSCLSARWRGFSRRVRGKKDRPNEMTNLPRVSWSRCGTPRIPQLWEHDKSNGNVKLAELGVLSAFAADCEDGTNLFEIGTFDGRTTLNLALNSPAGCRIHTLDLPPDTDTRFSLDSRERHMVQKPKSGARYEKHRASQPDVVNKIHQTFGDSAELDPAPYEQSCSLVFVDGSHAYEYLISDTEKAIEMIRDGGVIVWHDYGVWEGVNQGLEEIEARDRLGLKHIDGTSLVFWKKPKPA
jgi:hypothetical protein